MSATTVRAQITEYDLGSGWETLHEQARLHRRTAREQLLVWLRYVAVQVQDGVDVELSRPRLEQLLRVRAA